MRVDVAQCLAYNGYHLSIVNGKKMVKKDRDHIEEILYFMQRSLVGQWIGTIGRYTAKECHAPI